MTKVHVSYVTWNFNLEEQFILDSYLTYYEI